MWFPFFLGYSLSPLISTLLIFPEMVFGNTVTNSTIRGYLYGAGVFFNQNSRIPPNHFQTLVRLCLCRHEQKPNFHSLSNRK
jgi:hypothetical protein